MEARPTLPIQGATIASSIITVSGTATGPVRRVTWANATTGAFGAASGTNSWSFTVNVIQGNNRIKVSAMADDAQDTRDEQELTVVASHLQ